MDSKIAAGKPSTTPYSGAIPDKSRCQQPRSAAGSTPYGKPHRRHRLKS